MIKLQKTNQGYKESKTVNKLVYNASDDLFF